MSQRVNEVVGPERRSAANAISEDVILDAATRLMSTIGIRRTTMADVARTAGVSRATLYRRFPNVETLAAQVTTREFTRIVSAAPVAASPESRPSIIAALGHIVSHARRHPLLQRIIELDPEFLTPYLLQRTGQTSRAQLTAIEDLLRSGQATGQIRAGDAHRLATTVLQMAWSFTLTGPVFAGHSNTTDLDTDFGDLLERYLRP